jgi:hypothetical protein
MKPSVGFINISTQPRNAKPCGMLPRPPATVGSLPSAISFSRRVMWSNFLPTTPLGASGMKCARVTLHLKISAATSCGGPNEIFLNQGEKIPDSEESEKDLSQEDLLKKPAYIPYRPVKDPRIIKMLDPACGSMHFGLYAFDLFEIIYREAWEMEELSGVHALIQSEDLKPLHETYKDKASFLANIPRLIIEYNIHGIDIDPRAVQVAALALWLRAQKSWKTLGIKATDRPRITKSNIVTAEPMPGDEDMRREFTESLKPRVLGQLLDVVFEKMKLAGEAGSLLKIEEEIKDAVAKAKKQWAEGPKPEQQILFPGMARTWPKQQELRFDVKGITDERFWEQAEDRILEALKEYSERAENGRSVRRRLFAEDAARGLAFIDLCRKRYHAVLMNPPFGEAAYEAHNYLEQNYPRWSKNILCSFIDRMKTIALPEGYVGAIFDRTAAIKSSYEDFRSASILPFISTVADTGWYVLDANVETTVHVWMNYKSKTPATFFDVLTINPENKVEVLEKDIFALSKGQLLKDCYLEFPELLLQLPNAVVGYNFPEFLVSAFNNFLDLAESGYQARKGHDFVADEHVRLFWEVKPEDLINGLRFRSLYNGGGFSLFLSPLRDVAIFGQNGNLIRHHSSVYIRNEKYHLKPGIGYGKRGDILDAHVLPAGFSFTSEGLAITDLGSESALVGLGFLNSSFAQYTINNYCGQHKQVGYVNLLPFPKLDPKTEQEVIFNSLAIVLLKQSWLQYDETTRIYSIPIFGLRRNGLRELVEVIQIKMEAATAELNTRITRNDDIFCTNGVGCSTDKNEIIQKFQKQRPIDYIWPDLDCHWTSDNFSYLIVNFITSYCIGVSFGRWDVRIAINPSLAPKLPDPLIPCRPVHLGCWLVRMVCLLNRTALSAMSGSAPGRMQTPCRLKARSRIQPSLTPITRSVSPGTVFWWTIRDLR